MKIFKTISHCLLVFWVSLLMIGITGCGEDDDNEWVGTWTFESVDGESIELLYSDISESITLLYAEELEFSETDLELTWTATHNYTFDSDGMWEAGLTMKFEAKGEGSDFSRQGSIRITGTYAISDTNYTMTPMELEVTGVFKDLGLEAALFDTSDEDTGTWSRKGNTLTVKSDDGSVIVMKKR